MQGGRVPGLKFFDGALTLTSIDARPLMLAFGICAGAGLYFSLPSEPDLKFALAVSELLICLWLVARRWVTSDIVITLIVLALGVSAGLSAAAFRACSVMAPVIATETGPVMVEGWVQEIEPGRRGVRLLLRVHSIANMSNSDWPEYVRVTHTSRLEVAPGRFVR